MISPHPESNGLGIVDLPEDGSGAFEAPIVYLGLFDTFAVSSTKKSPASGLGSEQTATASTLNSDQPSRGGNTARRGSRQIVRPWSFAINAIPSRSPGVAFHPAQPNGSGSNSLPYLCRSIRGRWERGR